MAPSRVTSRLLLVLRVFVGVVFVGYGIVKILGGQFFYGDWTMSKSTVGGTFLVWAFYGYSPYYGRFIGFAEFIPAVLLLIPRTATVGAVLLFPLALNVTVMDFFYGFPSVKWMALLYTTILGVLLWADRGKLLLLLEPTEKVDAYRVAARSMTVAPRAPMATGLRRALVAALVILLVFLANLIGASLVAGPEQAAEAIVRASPTAPADVRLLRSRYTGLYGIGRTAYIDFVAGPLGADTIRVYAHRASGFTPWGIDSVAKPHR